MKTGLTDILAKYPEDKPTCVNYAEMRNDLIGAHEEIDRLQKRLAYFEEGLNPDAALEFATRADALLKGMDNLLDKTQQRVDIINEISQFLNDSGFDEASEAIDCHYGI
jgi:hypothetical protein